MAYGHLQGCLDDLQRLGEVSGTERGFHLRVGALFPGALKLLKI